MSQLLANRNTLQMLQGIENYTEWNFWVFEKPLTQLDEESEDIWLERLLHTAMAIEEQVEFIEHESYLDVSQQRKDIARLTKRLKAMGKFVGFIPTIRGIEDPNYLNCKKNNKSDKEHQPAMRTKQSKFKQYLQLRIEANIKTSIGDIWGELHKSQNEILEELIEVIDVSGKDADAVVRWVDDSTGKEGRMLTRKSVSKAMSEIRTLHKIKNLN